MRNTILGITLATAFAVPVHARQVPVNVRVTSPVIDRALMEADIALNRMSVQLAPSIDLALARLEMNMPLIEQSILMAMPQLEHSLAMLDMKLPLFMRDLGDVQLPPESWDAQDPGDSLYTAARNALDRGNPAQAANLYRRLRTEARFARSTYRSQAFYWEAYARDRVGSPSELRQAQRILADLRREFPRFEPMQEVTNLEAKINAALAANGDARAQQQAVRTAENVTRQQCPNTDDQEAALHALMSMDGQTSLPLLQRVMAKRDACSSDLRELAVMLIARTKSPEAETILIEAAKSDPDSDVREHAVMWLATQGSERSLEFLEEIVRSSTDEDMIQMAIMSLSRHNTPRANQLLRDLAARPNVDPDVRAFAIMQLGQRGDAQSIEFIRGLWPSLTDEDSKQAVLMAVARSKSAGTEEFLTGVVNNAQEPEDVRMMAFHQLSQSQNFSAARLGEMYDRATNEDMKQMIIMALGQSKDTTALDQLIRIGRAERDADLRTHIIHMIGQGKFRNDPRAVRFLTDIIGGGN